MDLTDCLNELLYIISSFQDYIEYHGYCNTDQGVAYDLYDYDFTKSPGTAAACLEWCRYQKQNSPVKHYVACDYDETYCEIIEDGVVTGGDGTFNALCWVFVSGNHCKFTFVMNFHRYAGTKRFISSFSKYIYFYVAG